MKFIGSIKEIIYKADLLDSGSLLRIKGEPQHKTLFGGMVSITLMILLAAAFWSKILGTLDKVLITSSIVSNNADEPTPFKINTKQNGTFMLGVEILNVNLNDDKRYFDVELINTVYNYGVILNSSTSLLEPCTKQHWSGYPNILDKFDKLSINYWMCFPMNKSFEIKGKYTSAELKTLDIIVSKCSNNTMDLRPCASQVEIDSLFEANGGNLYLTPYFINALINAESQTYLKYYLQDTNYIAFSQKGGEESRIFIEDFQIQTDQSILPNSDLVIQSGGIVTKNGIKSTFFSMSQTYAAYYFFKSSTSLTFNRSFQKLDDVFSYIGGLFGTILIAFFLIGAYNTNKFQINLAGYLYRNGDHDQKLEKNYNFLLYLGQLIYGILRALNFSPNWRKLSRYYNTRQQMLKQLDILFLLKRINFLQTSLSLLFTEHQLVGLHLANHFTIDDAIISRKNYRLKAKLKGELDALKKKNRPQIRQNMNENNVTYEDMLKANQDFSKQETFDKKQINVELDNSFQSDCYSSESSSEQGDCCVIDSIKILQREKEENNTSKRIWMNIDYRFKHIIDPLIIQKENKYCLQDNANKNKSKAVQHLNQFVNPNFEDSNNNEGDKDLALSMFEMIRVVHAQSQLEFGDKQR